MRKRAHPVHFQCYLDEETGELLRKMQQESPYEIAISAIIQKLLRDALGLAPVTGPAAAKKRNGRPLAQSLSGVVPGLKA